MKIFFRLKNDMKYYFGVKPHYLRRIIWQYCSGIFCMGYKDLEPRTIVGGNPAKFIKKRVIKE